MLNSKTTIEDVRAYWNRSPCNIGHSKKELYTKEYYDEVERKKYFVEPHIPKFADFPSWRDMKVLEIGCGIGTDTINFARHGAHVTAVDLSDRSIEIAKKRACIFDLTRNIRFICCNCEELSSFVISESFDMVYSFGVLHHTINPSKALEEIRKVMHKNSELRIMLYSKYSIKRLEIMLGLCTPQAQPGEPLLKTTTANGVRRWLKGFKVMKIEKTHIFTWKIKQYVSNKYEKRFLWRVVPEPLFRILEKALGWHMLITAKIRED